VNIRHGIAAEPGSGNRQLQEKAGGIDPDGLFSLTKTIDASFPVVTRTQRITSTRMVSPENRVALCASAALRIRIML